MTLSPPPPILVQARASSRRLPSKVLRELRGRPMLAHALARLKRSRRAGPVVVATSDRAEDDAVAALAEALGVAVYRGSLDDVAGRMLAAARALGAEAFVRVCGDSPFIDPRLVDQAVELFMADGAALAGNVAVRSFPKGFSVEVVSVEALARAWPLMDDGQREHVTPYFYAHPDHFRLASFTRQPPLDHVQLSVDTEEDFALAEAILAAMGDRDDDYGLDDVLAARARVLGGAEC